VWLAATGVYTVAFWMAAGAVGHDHRHGPARWLVGLQAAAALVMFNQVCTGLESMQLVLVAAQVGLFFSLPAGVVWVLGQACVQWSIAMLYWPTNVAVGVTVAFTLPYSVLALFIAYFAARQTSARDDLARINAELRATQTLLEESSRLAERARISQELHDILGHHLTALTLNLEAASHRSKGEARESVQKAQAIARHLLGEVRDAVTAGRGQSHVNLARALDPIVTHLPRPAVHLDLADDVVVANPEQAHALLRCVQELVTNSARHGGADNLWITLRRTEDGLEVRAHDDGRGAGTIAPGQGLGGMRQRFETLGGRLTVASEPGKGFRLEAWIPLREPAS
jgi:signal transduction histidine kinase